MVFNNDICYNPTFNALLETKNDILPLFIDLAISICRGE
jgi:hypothetical protein